MTHQDNEPTPLDMAKHAVRVGSAGSWKIVAGFLYEEIERLEKEVKGLINALEKYRGQVNNEGEHTAADDLNSANSKMTDRIFTDAYDQAMPEHGEGWDYFADRIKRAMQDMENLLRDAAGNIDRRTVEGVRVQERIESFFKRLSSIV